MEVGVELLWNDQTKTHRLPIEREFARTAADTAILVGASVFDALTIEKGGEELAGFVFVTCECERGGLVCMAEFVCALRIDYHAPEPIVATDHAETLKYAGIEWHLDESLFEETLESQEHLRLILIREEDGADVGCAGHEPFCRGFAHAPLIDVDHAHALGDVQNTGLLLLEWSARPYMLLDKPDAFARLADDANGREVSAATNVHTGDISGRIDLINEFWIDGRLGQFHWKFGFDLSAEDIFVLLVECDGIHCAANCIDSGHEMRAFAPVHGYLLIAVVGILPCFRKDILLAKRRRDHDDTTTPRRHWRYSFLHLHIRIV